MVTVRKLVSSDGDEFGDVPVEPSRGTSFTITMIVTYNRRETSIGGAPGRDVGIAATALVRKSDCDRNGWTPEPDDMIQIPGGDSLFIRDAQPETVTPPRLGNPSGGWMEYRLVLSSSNPSIKAAGTYD